MTPLYDSAYVQINFNEYTQTLELIWKETVSDLTYEDTFFKGLKYLKETNATSWISDIRRQPSVKPERGEWLKKNIFPAALETCLEKIAIVTTEDESILINIELIKESLHDHIKVKYFHTVENAYSWIQEKEQ